MTTTFSTGQPIDLAQSLFDIHGTYLETALTHRRFKQQDILPLIEKRTGHSLYEIEIVGKSFEGRDILMIKVGTGPRKVLLWTQMHGDEPTATMAGFDMLNFLEGKDEGLETVRQEVLTNTTLYFVPMLNPDGAERYQRRNAQEIDINRDALALQAPESRILKQLQQTLQPEFGFNLHDKDPRYSVGNTPRLATVSFLATAYDQARNTNATRKKAMQLIAVMNRALQKFIPKQVGKWNEDFEPRAFGDNIQKWGTTLILIEAGGYAGDTEKQYIRKLNFISLLTGLASIAANSFASEGVAEYHALPENSRYIFDLLIRNATVTRDGKHYQTDLGINRHEINKDHATSFFYKSKIEEYGDLSVYFGTEELDASGLDMKEGAVYPEHFNDLDKITESNAWSLLRQGYTYIFLDQEAAKPGSTQLPLHICLKETPPSGAPGPDDTATFILRKDDAVKFAIVNGFLHDVTSHYRSLGNGLIE